MATVTLVEMARVMETLLEHRAKALPAQALAEIFDRLIWCMDDEGAAVVQIREEWLLSDNRGRVEVALAMSETFPFRDATRMVEVLRGISSKWPELSDACSRLQEARARQESQ